MIQQIIHVYLMPGMAASSKIFENIELPSHQFETHCLEWIPPFDNESISNYALRMAQKIKEIDVVLIGVSFGGILVQEMSKHIKVRKLIIVSSVKTMHELPKRMKFAKATKAYKLLPTQLVNNMDVLAKYAFGKNVIKRIDLYKKYLSINDSNYLSWAIEKIVCWNQDTVIPDIIHIQGENDPVFPTKHMSNYISISKGTHIMIINKYKWFNENLPRIILEK
ncbi:alpha/beta hydrolase [Pseudalgibacter alginicilyticus]|uniref:Alpha/beta hydrolase n=1 Tax=Pseudalgibacter alginicilyticus TaxID=1736674 RepID=A0A0P0CJK5_9FLAO|nr:alpha/beta hydrolase [Pseudalgibacter alginicilyticus]ALJ06407.1 alpha/beta hydrolase [Pseudalgibacter alginicilyticus]